LVAKSAKISNDRIILQNNLKKYKKFNKFWPKTQMLAGPETVCTSAWKATAKRPGGRFSSFFSRTGDLQVGRHASVRAEELQIQRSPRRTGKPDWRGAHAPTVAPRRQPEGGDKAVEELAVANGA
jgi:hypothetical protein